jgi:hypothetical protein
VRVMFAARLVARVARNVCRPASSERSDSYHRGAAGLSVAWEVLAAAVVCVRVCVCARVSICTR